MVTIPTLQELKDKFINALETSLNVTIPTFGKNFLNALSAVSAAKLYLFYTALGNVQKNMFADTADLAVDGGTLERIGVIKGIVRQPAVSGQYTVSVEGEIGSVIPVNTTFKSNDDSNSPSQLYILDNSFTFSSTTGLINLRALDAGLGSQLIINDGLTATAPIALVSSDAIVTAELVTPIEIESIEDFRQRILNAYRLEPQGGAGADYRLWGSEAFGVKEIYPFTTSGVTNEVDVFVEATISDSTDGKGSAGISMLDAVKSSIEDPTADRPARKPLTDIPNYYSVTPLDVNITINSSAYTPAQESLITSALTNRISDIRPFVGSIDILSDKNDLLDINIIISEINNAVSGIPFGAVELEVDGIIYPSFTFEFGNIPYLNSVIYA